MGNTCVGPNISKNGFIQSVSAAMWRTPTEETPRTPNGEQSSTHSRQPESPLPVQNKPPEQIMIPKPEKKQEQPVKPKKGPQMKRVSSAGLRTDSVLQRKTGSLKEFFTLGKKLGQGQFGTTFLCTEKSTGQQYACKSIAKRKLLTDEDVEDVRREIQIMHHLAGHPNVIAIKGAYEDAIAVHVVMELCAGGELFDRIIQVGHYTEKKASELTRTIVGVVETYWILKVQILVIAESLSEEEIAGLKQMFQMLDADNSGQITFEELKAGLKRVGANLRESEIYDLMQAADVDNSGTIDYGEFVAATLHLNKIEKEDHLFAAFSYFDKDGSGYITADELQQACDEFGINAHLEELLQDVDQDNDGRIDYNEFVAMMQGHTGSAQKKSLDNSFSIKFREAFKL
ncbi:hypothetical protein M8C21_027484 [Ambrosia artemisiifolia]|uniref:non-specific serine/threonine protein kinase n=1 Tax=Ambrosia artemisiifolia TaxID=4212 RepID=A0AAD5CVG0_AMBAR|nr:hypothetical protein M8C21_027484 [Ambrosia artemisiifolia]